MEVDALYTYIKRIEYIKFKKSHGFPWLLKITVKIYFMLLNRIS